MIKSYKSPLNIYVVWHPKFIQGGKYANQIYASFCRDPLSPLSRGLGIPVFFRSNKPSEEDFPVEIKCETAQRNAIILLIDDEMFNDSHWSNYIDSLLKHVNTNTRIFPVQLSQYAHYQNEGKLNKYQFVRINLEDDFISRWSELKNALLHDLCRLMINMDATYENPTSSHVPPPVKLFLSHAKQDGEVLARNFLNYIENNLKLNTFFDANDIADGYEFETQIKAHLKNSAVIVFLSDLYSSREWCRIEVIVAKRYKSPLVVVYNIEKGESRSFPYLGNVPTIKWNNNINEVIDLALIQVLNNLYAKEKIDNEIKLYGIDVKYNCDIITNPPELFNFIDIGKNNMGNHKKNIVVYPDPPIGIEELNVLNDLEVPVKFITPILFSNIL